MKKVVFIFLNLFICFNISNSQTTFRKENSFFIKLYGGKSSASSYYDIDEKRISDLKDMDRKNNENDYTFDFSKQVYGLSCEYSLNNKLTLTADLPISVNNLEEIYKFDDKLGRVGRNRYSLTHIEYLGLGARYELFSQKSFGYIYIETRTPPGFKRGILDTSRNSFLSDGALEILTGIGIGIKSEKYFLESLLLYNFRDEELVDQLVIITQAGICTVPNSALAILGEFVLSTKSFKEAIPLITNHTVTQEEYFALGLSFSMFFSEAIYGEFNYNLRLFGKNSWEMGTYRIGAGVLFN